MAYGGAVATAVALATALVGLLGRDGGHQLVHISVCRVARQGSRYLDLEVVDGIAVPLHECFDGLGIPVQRAGFPRCEGSKERFRGFRRGRLAWEMAFEALE